MAMIVADKTQRNNRQIPHCKDFVIDANQTMSFDSRPNDSRAILVVSADLTIQKHYILNYSSQCRIHLSVDACDALRSVEEAEYSMIFIDYAMPGLDILQFIKFLRGAGVRSRSSSVVFILHRPGILEYSAKSVVCYP